MKSGDKIVLHNMITGLPEVVRKGDRDPHGWLFWALVGACVLAGVMIIRDVIMKGAI